MLKFIGNGSAFNYKLGNNSAFIENDDRLILIDCGETTFERLMKAGILENKRQIDVIITHTHPDHIGSLGTLIFYAYFILKIKPTIYSGAYISTSIESILKLNGVTLEYYNQEFIYYNPHYTKIQGLFFTPVDVKHDKNLTCYGYIISNQDQVVYYSGDSNMIPSKIIKDFEDGLIDTIYQDTSYADYEGNIHLSLFKLMDYIKPELRNRIWCMHLDGGFNREEAEKLGFNVTKNILEGS